jgi:hypothetical protein
MSILCERVDVPSLPPHAVLPGRVGIVIPAYNEAAQIASVLTHCRAVRPAIVVVVDDASSDGTDRVLAAESPLGAVPIRVLRNPQNLGKQGSVRRGLRELAGLELDAVALIDGDGQHDPAELPGLAALLADHELVIGARSRRQMPWHRRLANRLVNLGFRLLGGVDFHDLQSGLRLYRKPLADLLARELPPDGGYGLEHESIALLARFSHARGRVIRAAAATVSCVYGVSRSKMRPLHVLGLGVETVRQGLRLRRALRGLEDRAPALPRALTVEIHDISPATRDETLAIWGALGELGIERATLLVVPSFVDEAGVEHALGADPALCAWLRERQAAGAEIVQHGLTHRAPGPPPPGVGNAFMHHVFSRGQAEFAHLTRDEARARLLAGRRILAAAGLRPVGFVAPAWQQSPQAIGVLARLGYGFTAFLDHLLPLGGDPRPVPTVALTFAAPDPLVDYGKRAVMRGLEALARPSPLLRVALHPEDLRGARPLAHILERLRRLLRHRRQVTYAEWLSEREPQGLSACEAA